MAISNIVPADAGLDRIVGIVLSSKNPASDLFRKLGDYLYPPELIRFRGEECSSTEEFVQLMRAERERMNDESIKPPLIITSGFLMLGMDYLDADAAKKREHFWLGDQTYYLVLPKLNAYNPCFAISLFPERTTSIGEKSAMMDAYGDKRFPRGYKHVKTVLFHNHSTNQYYLAVVAGEDRVNTKAFRRELSLSKSQANITPASEDPGEITGREAGAVSPLLHRDHFQDVSHLFIDKSLLAPYSVPHYSVPIDRRSALVLSDVGALERVLKKTERFPNIVVYDNSQQQ